MLSGMRCGRDFERNWQGLPHPKRWQEYPQSTRIFFAPEVVTGGDTG